MVAELTVEDLFNASRNGDLDTIKDCLKRGIQVDARSKYGSRTALHDASTWGHVQCVQYLLEMGTDVDATCMKGRTALHRASAWNHVECVRALLSAGAEIDARDSNGCTALHDALRFGHRDTMILLLENHANVHIVDNDGGSPLNRASGTPHFLLMNEHANRQYSHIKEIAHSSKSQYTPMSDITASAQGQNSIQTREICLSDHLDIKKILGSGGYGIVSLVERPNGQQLALKQAREYNEKVISMYTQEYDRQFELRHPNLVEVFQFVHDPEENMVGYTMELMDRSLHAFMEQHMKLNNQKLPLDVVLHISLEILGGLIYLHDKKLSHDDLKPENVLLRYDVPGEHPIVKLCDFGAMSIRSDISRSCTRNIHTTRYAAPERLRGGKYSLSADVYSFGVMLNEMLSGERPFCEYDMENDELIDLIVNHPHVRPRMAANIPSQLQKMIVRCWSEPTRRPSLRDVQETIQKVQESWEHCHPKKGKRQGQKDVFTRKRKLDETAVTPKQDARQNKKRKIHT